MRQENTNRMVRFGQGMAAIAIAIAGATPVVAGTTSGEQTISIAGSTALKNWLVANTNTFTDVIPYDVSNSFSGQLSIGGVAYPTVGNSYWPGGGSGAGGNLGLSYQVAPKNFTGANLSATTGAADAIRFEFHESGSVEGLLELVNDQIKTVNYVTQNINRNPETGNAVWVNYTQIGASGTTAGANWSPTTGATVGGTTPGHTLGNFYSNGVGGSGASKWNGTQVPTFSTTGVNAANGQNAVQIATSDALPVVGFKNVTGASDTHAAQPWLRKPTDLNYGAGNTALVHGSLGTAGGGQEYQSTDILNMKAADINPRTGVAYGNDGAAAGVGFNTRGLGNLQSTWIASTASLIVANPGTGLTRIDKTDSQWLQTAGRLQNGVDFNMTTRDTGSGTRAVPAINAGIDPTWAVGENDNGNGNLSTGVSDAASLLNSQVAIGPSIKFSNKTAGGAELRPTVQNARMSVGTLSINDANSVAFNNTTVDNPIRGLSYLDSDKSATANSNGYVQAGYDTISNGTYALSQNEHFVTVIAPGTTNIQGDTATHDAATLIQNTQAAILHDPTAATIANPADGLLNQGYLIPQLIHFVTQNNGTTTTVNPLWDPSQYATYITKSIRTKLQVDDPTTITTGSGSTRYGDKVNAAVIALMNGTINITSSNYLFGNFNQNGIRDYTAVLSAVNAQAALETGGTSAAGVSMYTADGGLLNSTPVSYIKVGGGSVNLTKGDLIVLGDYNADGKFDGKDLYAMAAGAAVADSTSAATLTVSNPTGQNNNFSDALRSATLRKNAALDAVNLAASDAQKAEATANSTNDPSGKYAFDKHDVNRDGVVDFNDALLVDKFNGAKYSSLDDSLLATRQDFSTPTGVAIPVSLVAVGQVDSNYSTSTGVTALGAADVTEINAGLKGASKQIWYPYGVSKTGPGTVEMNDTFAGVTVNSGASLTVSRGTLVVGKTAGSTNSGVVDPFTTTGTAGVATTASLPITVGNSTVVSAGVTNTFSGKLEIAGGAQGVSLNVYRTGSLTVSGGGNVTLDKASNHTNHTLLVAGALSVAGSNAKIDLNDNDLLIHNGDSAAITALVKSGLNIGGNFWGGNGITSSEAAGDGTFSRSIAVVPSTTGQLFDGLTSTLSTDVLVKSTFFGDADLNGAVNPTDYTQIDFGYANHLAGWTNGDFNYDGTINAADYSLADNAFAFQGVAGGPLGAAPLAQALAVSTSGAVPEPTTIGMLATAGLGLLARRRRVAK